MFWHNLKYEVLSGLRVKDVIFWLILFPIVLGTFFKIAFSDLYEKENPVSPFKVAVVETEGNEVFHSVMDEISEGDTPLFKAVFMNGDEALEKLKNEEVYGIIYSDNGLSLTVSGEGLEQSIIKSFVEQYTIQEKIITDTAKNHPENINAVISALGNQISSNTDIPLTEGNTDYYIGYFYNLIAMVALFGSITGLHISISSQGNLSALGARKCCSPTPKIISIITGLIGSYIIQAICVLISVSFIAFVLRVDFGNRLPLVYLSGIIGGIMGVSFGFMVGSFGKMSQGAKIGISTTVSMLCCFFSGLMVGNMKAVVAEKAPWFNEINPAALVSDSFYCLNVYSDYNRYIQKNAVMLLLSVVFAAVGFILTRRRKYASL
ncbi:MAG: ABC transporter permease [Porcipelethomonas sp.]